MMGRAATVGHSARRERRGGRTAPVRRGRGGMPVCLPARVIRRFTACHAICLFVVITRVASDYRDSRVRLLALYSRDVA